MSRPAASAIIEAIRDEIDQAVTVILDATVESLALIGGVQNGAGAPLADLERRLLGVLEACAFQDMTGQRLSQLDAMLSGVDAAPPDRDSLLNGPALPGAGLDQDLADRLLQRPTA